MPADTTVNESVAEPVAVPNVDSDDGIVDLIRDAGAAYVDTLQGFGRGIKETFLATQENVKEVTELGVKEGADTAKWGTAATVAAVGIGGLVAVKVLPMTLPAVEGLGKAGASLAKDAVGMVGGILKGAGKLVGV